MSGEACLWMCGCRWWQGAAATGSSGEVRWTRRSREQANSRPPAAPPTRCSWIPDELSPSTFPRLGELRPVPVADYDQRFDRWVITAQLSEGCGGPELGEEVIL